MKIRIHNNDGTDFIDFEGETVEEIQALAALQIKLPGWENGWSEEL